MTVTAIHPGQQRSSCEGCRKQKARCQRLQPGDARCARCMMHNIPCVAGRQKRIGRPGRAAERGTDPAQATTETRQPRPKRPRSNSPRQASDQTRSGSASSPSSQGSSSSSSSSSSSAAHLHGSAGYEKGWDSSRSSPGGQSIAGPSPESSSPGVPFGPRGNDPTTTTHADAIFHAVTALSLMNVGLHSRTQAVEAYKHVMTVELIIYQRGPLYINNTTLSQFILQTSREFVALLHALQTDIQGRKLQRLQAATWASPPQHSTAAATATSTSSSSTTELPATISLLITSIFKQLLDLYDLYSMYCCARVAKLADEPVAPFPGPAGGGVWQLTDACLQGLLYTQTIHRALEQTERVLGIAWGASNGGVDGLLSPRQMHTLWHEVGGELGSGITRTETVKTGLRKAAFDLQKLIAYRLN
ncbi:hypothetical protein Cob_v011623 [Colletotrichum orbiculare MAFF 240422]|uniref:Uncharacterized protein n=1 Tax=Colletotrichum orbiculare (strain 104-T / ATCC 96160 / CBS 514.97 / LARS 414 / MAFF 240422) TaxID=1213857 RepID=N4V2F3_COLOR|nr:hypothetical protein Cob_v011623 [Colletotrichum orbiculare MAFF 240422]